MNDLLTEFFGQFKTAEEPVHARHVHVKLIDGGFFIYRHAFADDVGHHVRVHAVLLMVAFYHDGMGTKQPCRAHGHSRMYAEGPRLVAAGSHAPPVAAAPHEDGLTVQGRIVPSFYRNEKTIQVHMHHLPVHDAKVL